VTTGKIELIDRQVWLQLKNGGSDRLTAMGQEKRLRRLWRSMICATTKTTSAF